MIFLWILTTVSLLAAIASWHRARRIAQRLEQLSQMYWELKYENGELRVKMDRAAGQGLEPSQAAAPVSKPADKFVPLASLRR